MIQAWILAPRRKTVMDTMQADTVGYVVIKRVNLRNSSV